MSSSTKNWNFLVQGILVNPKLFKLTKNYRFELSQKEKFIWISISANFIGADEDICYGGDKK